MGIFDEDVRAGRADREAARRLAKEMEAQKLAARAKVTELAAEYAEVAARHKFPRVRLGDGFNWMHDEGWVVSLGGTNDWSVTSGPHIAIVNGGRWALAEESVASGGVGTNRVTRWVPDKGDPYWPPLDSIRESFGAAVRRNSGGRK